MIAVAEWETTDFTLRSVEIDTDIEVFATFHEPVGGKFEYVFPPETVGNGHAQIKVIPAPAPFLALACLFCRRAARHGLPHRRTR